MFIYLPWIMAVILLIPGFFLYRYIHEKDWSDLIATIFISMVFGTGLILSLYVKSMMGQIVWVCSKESKELIPKQTDIGTVYEEKPGNECHEYKRKIFTEDGWYYLDK